MPWPRTGAERNLLFKGEGTEQRLDPRLVGFHRVVPVSGLGDRHGLGLDEK
jgi:hypothetical protein